ncbi:GNAT family N-acetyltransferase [Niastella yeongjuensis]|uniref:GNAT family N-acetyltransferase n=1 Tax=Niastella yeongjuensis TaxID=354355 RepID=A0A1V9DYC9_9BACT|nr:GNAT family N-acetyltransferase [Niastella yeongjuensis]OQP38888.1 GNAT family N-acetyltransferase [Niastella yeongjuensis]SEO28991.1 L-amino acid N-acyltransferase YncA [Niastella yeongjuensis]
MITYTRSTTKEELEQILALQKQNLAVGLTEEQIAAQGFVTVSHSFTDLYKMNELEAHVIAKDNDRVIGYILAMTVRSRLDIPILLPMFDLFDAVTYQHKKIADYNYMVVGQVCVAADYRGQGVFDACYKAYSSYFNDKYDFAITEIATRNQRSLHAHKRVGFETIHSYVAPDGEEWNIVIWKW